MLLEIYRETLKACAPDALIRPVLRDDFPRTVVAIGKCAGALIDGFGDIDDALVVIPAGYPRPKRNVHVIEGGHPEMTADSFEAGRALLDFVAAHDEITFLISGGGSACVEWPLDPFTQRDLIDANTRLIRSGASIADINCVRKHLSAIKGGRLAARLRRSVTFVYSDVSDDALADVASGPTLPDPTTREEASRIAARYGVTLSIGDETVKRINDYEVHLIAANSTLTATAATIATEMGWSTIAWHGQIEGDVAEAATTLVRAVARLRSREILIAGGEPTTVQRGDGKGGRCTELAVRFALANENRRIQALFGSSDGVDGNSESAGAIVDGSRPPDRVFAMRELDGSNSAAVVGSIGSALPLCPSGNNLRDLYLLACT